MIILLLTVSWVGACMILSVFFSFHSLALMGL